MPDSPKSLEVSKICPHCGLSMPANRGVCPNPDCDYVSSWFKVRFLFGCAGAIFAAIVIAIMTWMAITASP